MTLQPTPVLVKKAKKKEGEPAYSFFFFFLVLSVSAMEQSLTSHPGGGVRSAPSGPDDRHRVAG